MNSQKARGNQTAGGGPAQPGCRLVGMLTWGSSPHRRRFDPPFPSFGDVLEQGKLLERKKEGLGKRCSVQDSRRLPLNHLMERFLRRLATKEAALPPRHRR